MNRSRKYLGVRDAVSISTTRDVSAGVMPLVSSRSSILVALAALCYVMSMHKFAVRDPLSTNTGIQGLIETFAITSAFALVVLAVWGRKRQMALSPAAICMVVFATFVLASYWRSFNPALSFVKGFLLLMVLASGSLACQAGLGRQHLRWIYWGYVASLVAGILVGVLLPSHFPLLTIDAYSGRTRFSVFDTFPGWMGEDAALLLLLAPLLGESIGWASQLFLFAMNVMAGGKTSTAVLCALFLVRFLSRIDDIRSWRGIATITGCATFLGGIAATLLNKGLAAHLLGRYAQGFYGTDIQSDATTFDGRLDLWKSALGLLQHAQLLGYGSDGAREVFLRVAGWSGNSHSGYLEEALASGVLGFCLLLASLILVLLACLRAHRPFRLHALLVISFILINSFISGLLTIPSDFGLLVLLWLSYEAQSADPAKIPASGPMTNELVRMKSRWAQ